MTLMKTSEASPGDSRFDSGFDFTVPEELSAAAPAEARGVPRDRVRMLIGYRSTLAVSHRRFDALTEVLRPGDLLVVNNSGTIPAALRGVLPDGEPVALHVSAAEPGRPDRATSLVELRRPQDGSSRLYPQSGESPVRVGLRVSLPDGASAELTAGFTRRLWYARLDLPRDMSLLDYLNVHGKPIRYSYVARDWPLSAYQTVFATEPGSSEMPSAARPFTAELVARLVARGIIIAPITLHTGLASPEAHEAPYAERFRVPAATAQLVEHVRAQGGRVVAVGTTAVRAVESAVDRRGRVRPAEGWTDLVITPERGVRAVDGLLTGWHEPRASHLQMLQAVAGRPLLDLCYAEAIDARYRWHEFGDVNLLFGNATDRS